MMDIVIKNLYKSFGDNVVLNNVNAVIKHGQVTCLMGQSGVGKTTLLNIMMGFEKADRGEVLNVPAIKSAVFQENRLCEEFSTITNIRLVNDSLDTDTIMSHLGAVNLEDAAKQKVNTLSGGMKRRVALVRAILAQKDILFLDEPFKGLDEGTKEKVTEYLKENTKGLTVVMVTHDIEEAQSLGAQVIYLTR
ncbi:MAG: ATP-binding cassette domain-containing protein [Oscillospiraceae bacterium]|nr:ATP-binding cassette domain-containing protein [Oscillospiraceae bacterium]